jgi:NAD(P)-dependent dehydrogenase (short-subunit alcohol dehydrogenase family)
MAPRENERMSRTAVVTGGGRGFGKAFGAALAAQGLHVVLVDIDEHAAREAAAEIGGRTVGLGGDVADEARMGAIMTEAARLHGGIDILINNAGLFADKYSQPLTVLGLAGFKRLFEVNVTGVVCCSLAAIPFMKGRAGASIVNIASSAAHLGGSPYGDSKLAVAGLTITLARELGRDGIRVNAISPGMIVTSTVNEALPEATKARIKAMQMIDRDGAEEDIVEAMLYLTSDKARFITGETLRVTGGMSAGV